MWLSLNMISDIIDINGISPEDIALRLTMSSAEIEDVEYVNHYLKTVIAAKVEEVYPHPNADKLTLVDLYTGKEKVRVVCGAPNHRKGDIVALATVGTKFNEEFEIKKTKIRGEESSGMLCSEKELGISDDHSGIMILPAGTRPGTPLSELFPDMIDTRLEIDNKSITHRPDLWSHTGFAREISAIFGRKPKNIIKYDLQNIFRTSDNLSVRIDAPEGAARYCGLLVKNITIKESPDWLKARMNSIGMRPINNIVDVTNYVMAEIGQPMHAFDRKKLKGNEIIVRMAKDKEKFRTLDNQEHELSSEDVVIADSDGAIALAGVMGGAYSEIDDTTREIVLEAANFNYISIRKTAKRHTLRTEAAVRFEKSLDPELCPAAIIRCYNLIKQLIPEAEAATKIIDAYPGKPEGISIRTSSDFIRKKLGQQIPDKRIIEILRSLDFTVSGKDTLQIGVPTYRATGDVSIPDDIAEEVGRIFGYGNITPKPPYVPCIAPDTNYKRLFERNIKNILVKDHHLTEVSNYSFTGGEILDRIGINENKELRLQNPLSLEHDRLVRSLVPNILTNILLNQKYNEYFRIFELSRVYLKESRKSADLAVENTRVTGAVYIKKTKSPVFYEAKKIALDLIDQLKIKNIEYKPSGKDLPPYAHPARSMDVFIDRKNAGILFELHPKIIQDFGINGHAAIFDLNMEDLFNSGKSQPAFIELQKFPDVPFEISVIADKQTYADDVCSIIMKSSKDYVKQVEVISIYSGEQIPEGKKSISIKIIFTGSQRTLTPEEIEKLQKKTIDSLNREGFSLR